MLLPALSPDAPDRPALIEVDGRRLSSDGLRSAAGAVADRVAGASVIAVHATASLETVVAVLGGLAAGVPVVPVAPDAGPAERSHVLSDSGAVLFLVGAGGEAPGAEGGVPDGLERVEVEVAARGRGSHGEPAGDATGMILYTSGTTGPPKGVVISRAAIAADLDGLADAWDWTPTDTLVHGLPLFHAHGLVFGVLGALRVGGPLIHTGRPTPERYAEAVTRGGSLYFGVPTVWSRVVADPAAATELRRARLLVSGSAPLPRPTFDALLATTKSAPVERYGMTETLITIAVRADGERRPGWVGVPLAGVSTRVLGADGEPVPADGESVGELEVAGPMLSDCYLNRPDATAESYVDGWFRTGDVAAVDAGGYHRLLGRASTDLIKSGGYRIGAGEVEDALLSHPAVREAAVVGLPDEDLGQVVTAFVVADGVEAAALTDFVASRLSVHKRPRRVVLVDDLPRNAMGKVQKARLVS
ncbi:MAG: acyl-CoA synthetase [Acidimicrobiaceae bacterium]|nr:acyl-CoA synthetase [Acidimicrobiaceae bacterium]